jgi:hypothetical protein
MSAFQNVVKLIKEWKPGAQPTELKYRDSLISLLRVKLKDAQIEKEYRHTGTTIDIYVKQSGFFGSSQVFVELKRNLLQKTQLDRLVGQVESLRPRKNPVIVLLCGETNPSLVTRFKQKYNLAEDMILGSTDFTLVVKEVVETTAQQQRGKRDFESLADRLEDAWFKHFACNVADSNNYFPELFMANLIKVRPEDLRKVAASMGDERIRWIWNDKGDRLYRVVSGTPRARPRV